MRPDPDGEHPTPPSPEEIAATRRGYREEIHKNRNQSTVSVQIARRMERASRTMLDAANEMLAEVQRNRERIH